MVPSEDLFLPDLLLFYSLFSKLVFEIHARNGKDSAVRVLWLALDYHDMMKIPILNDYIRGAKSKLTRVRDDSKGEVASTELFIPGILPKLPGRFYYLFGKPIKTKGMKEKLEDTENENLLYLHVKSEVENSIA